MRNRGVSAAGLLMTLAGLSSPAFALPPIEQRSATSNQAQIVDPADFGPRGAANIYTGAPASSPYVHTPPPAAAPAAGASPQWELINQMQQLQEEVQALRGMVEQQNYELEQLKKQQRERYVDIDTRLTRLAGGAASGSAVTAEPASEVPAPAAAVDAEGEKAAYDAAYRSVQAKQFDKAIQQFEAVLAQYPGGELEPNCYYWLGDLYTSKTPPDHDKSQGYFQVLLKKHPKNPKVPYALFKLGKMSLEKGDKAKAKRFFDRLIQDYPQSEAATHARNLMR